MAVLDKKLTLFDRDDKEELIPKEVELVINEDESDQLPFKGQTIFMTPLVRGEIKRMYSEMAMLKDKPDTDIDGDIIIKHCKKPEFTEADRKFLRGAAATVLVNTILSNSGLDLGNKKTKKKAVEDAEDDFGKN